MSASVTNELRTFLLDQLRSDIGGGDSASNRYYIAISSSTVEDYAPSENLDSREEQFRFRNGMQAVKALSKSSFVIPTVPWISNDTYEAYDNRNPDQTNFYVINSENEVFICVDSPNSPSTVEPTSERANFKARTFSTSDGYYWRYMYKMSNFDYSNFKSSKFSPVKKVVGIPFTAEEQQQLALQDSAVDGEILRLQIDSSGTGYPGFAPIMISGNGTGASFSADVLNGSIVSVSVDSDAFGNFKHGSGYDYAAADPISGSGILTPVFAPKGGLNADPVASLKSKSLMLQVDIQGGEGDTILTENEFRRIALIRNPLKSKEPSPIPLPDSDFTGNTGIAAKSLNLTPTSLIPSDGVFEQDNIFSTSIGSATAKVLYHDTTNQILYYYQDNETEFESFTNGLTIDDGSVSASIQSQNLPEVDAYSGDIMYLNNIRSIPRSEDQTEDIRIVIELG